MTRNTELPVPTRCAACPLRGLDVFRDRPADDVAFIQSFKIGELVVTPGGTVLMEHAEASHFYTVLAGWTFRYKTLSDGRRQIINFNTPGDFLGLQATLSDAMSHGVEALTDVVLCVFPRDRLWQLFAERPQLAYDVTWLAALEERTLDEHMLSIGRKTAMERMAYLLWFLFDKARGVGLTKRNRLMLPLRQQHIADALGLSLVHTNKTLQKLRAEGIVVLSEGSLGIEDEASLKALARVEDFLVKQRPLI